MCHFLPAPTVSDEKSSVLHQENGYGGRVQQRGIKTSTGLMEKKLGVIMETGKD